VRDQNIGPYRTIVGHSEIEIGIVVFVSRYFIFLQAIAQLSASGRFVALREKVSNSPSNL
jgi:hypothetical protein